MSDLMTFGIGFFIFICAFGIGYFTKRDKLENELEIEVELNVKLLKEKRDWILERANFRRTLTDPIKLAEILELAKSIDKATSDALRADSFPAQENVGAVSGQPRADVSPETTCCCMFCHCNEKTDLINSDNNVCDSCIKGAHFPSNDGNL